MEDGANCLIHFADEMQGSDSLLRRVSGGSRQSIRENLEPELEHKARKVSERFSENLHIITNEPSLAFFRIQEHVRKSLPQLVEQKHEVQEIHQNVQGACFDTEYAKNAVNAMQNSNVHFQNIQDLLKNAMFMKQQIEYEESRKQQERRQPSMYSTSGGGGSSGNLGGGGSSSGRGGRILSRSVSDAVATSSTGSGGSGGGVGIGGGGGGGVGGGGGSSSRGGRGGRGGGGGGGGRGGGRSSSSGGGGGLNRSNTTDSCDSSVSLSGGGGSSQPGSTKPTTRPEKKVVKNRNQSKQDTNKRPSVKSKRTGSEPSKKPL